MQIVNLTEDYTRQVAQLLVDGFADMAPTAWPELKDGLEEVHEALADEERINRIAIDEQGEVIGWIGGIPQYDGRVWELHPLVVRPDQQGKGTGRALVQDFERLARDRGGLTILLGTDDENGMTSISGVDVYPDPLKHLQEIKDVRRHPFEFYQKMGFVLVGIVPDANGYGKPDLLMAKRIIEG